jgi:hypothetical protein
LIHIDASAVVDAVGDGVTAEKSLDCIELLLRVHREGQHVLCLAPEDIVAFIRVLPRLSPQAKATLDHIRGVALELLGLQSRLTWHLELGLGAGFDGRSHPRPGGGNVIRASLHAFDRTTRTGKTILLGENLTDVDFYVELATLHLAARGRRGAVRVEPEARGAGGSTFAQEFARVAQEGRILLAIADSDRRYPEAPEDGPLGGTWRELKKCANGRPAFQRATKVDGLEMRPPGEKLT